MGKKKQNVKAKTQDSPVTDNPPKAPRDIGSNDTADDSNLPDMTERNDTEIAQDKALLAERARLAREQLELKGIRKKQITEFALLYPGYVGTVNSFVLRPEGGFKYAGTNSCCLEPSQASPSQEALGSSKAKCHHEICDRARIAGISYREMETINYYDMRLYDEKSERMRNALKKQRDVELERVKKIDEDDGAPKSRKAVASRLAKLLDEPTKKTATQDTARRELAQELGEMLHPETITGQPTPDQAASFTSHGDASLVGNSLPTLRDIHENKEEIDRIGVDLAMISQQIDREGCSEEVRAKLTTAASHLIKAQQAGNRVLSSVAGESPYAPAALRWQPHPHTRTNASGNIGRGESQMVPANDVQAHANAIESVAHFFDTADSEEIQYALQDIRKNYGPGEHASVEAGPAAHDTAVSTNAPGGSKFVGDKGHGSSSPYSHIQPTQAFQSIYQIFPPDFLRNYSKADQDALLRMFERFEQVNSDADINAFAKDLETIKKTYVEISPRPETSTEFLEDAIYTLLEIVTSRQLLKDAAGGASQTELAGRITRQVLHRAKNASKPFAKVLQEWNEICNISAYYQMPSVLQAAFNQVRNSTSQWFMKHTTPSHQKIDAVSGDAAGNLVSDETASDLPGQISTANNFLALSFVLSLREMHCCPAVAIVKVALHLLEVCKDEPRKFRPEMEEWVEMGSTTELPGIGEGWFNHFQILLQVLIHIFMSMSLQLYPSFTDEERSLICSGAGASLISAAVLGPAREPVTDLVDAAKGVLESEGFGVSHELQRAFLELMAVSADAVLKCKTKWWRCTEHPQETRIPWPFEPGQGFKMSTSVAMEKKAESLNKSLENRSRASAAGELTGVSKRTFDDISTILDLAESGPVIAQKALKLVEFRLQMLRQEVVAIPTSILDAVTNLREAASDGARKKQKCIGHALVLETNVSQQSRFVEDVSEEGSSITIADVVQAHYGVRKRVQEIIDGKGNLAYYEWVAKRIRCDAESGYYDDPMEPFERFEEFFSSVGPLPFLLKCTLDEQKVGLAPNPDPKENESGASDDSVEADIDEMIGAAALKKRQAFCSTEEWRIRKLAFHPSEELLDCEFIESMTQSALDELSEDVDEFEDYLEAVFDTYADAGVPVGEVVREKLEVAKSLVDKGKRGKAEQTMRDVMKMMVARWKVKDVILPEELILLGKEANEAIKRNLRGGDHSLSAETMILPNRTAEDPQDKVIEDEPGKPDWVKEVDEFMSKPWAGVEEQPTPNLKGRQTTKPGLFDRTTSTAARVFTASKRRAARETTLPSSQDLSARQLDTVERNQFVVKLRRFVDSATASMDKGEQIVKMWEDMIERGEQVEAASEHAVSMRNFVVVENRLCDGILLAAKAIAEARGWTDVVRDIQRAFDEAEASDNGSEEENSEGEDDEDCEEGDGENSSENGDESPESNDSGVWLKLSPETAKNWLGGFDLI